MDNHKRGPQHKIFRSRRLINTQNRRLRVFCDCGTELRLDQSFYCCNKCRDYYTSIQPESITNNARVKEPETPAEVKQFYKEIEQRKRGTISEDERKMVNSLTPVDDSPQAERDLRMAICPNPSNWTRGEL